MKVIKMQIDLPPGVPSPKTADEQLQDILRSVEHLIGKDKEYLHMAPTLPKIYESGVKYDVTLDGDGLYDIPTILVDNLSNIESLVAWRCAELRRQGIDAKPYIVRREAPSGHGCYYTLVVLWPDGTTENVVAMLGVCR